MLNRMKRASWMLGIAVVGALSVVSVAGATATYDFTSAGSGFTAEIGNAFTVALPIGAAIVALFVGWRVLKRLVHG
jgi:hypothetical protein